jgi:hypothetical protein
MYHIIILFIKYFPLEKTLRQSNNLFSASTNICMPRYLIRAENSFDRQLMRGKRRNKGLKHVV